MPAVTPPAVTLWTEQWRIDLYKTLKAMVTTQMTGVITMRTIFLLSGLKMCPKAKFFELRQIGFLGKHPCVTRNCAFSLPDSPEIAQIFCKQTRIGIRRPNYFSDCPETGLHWRSICQTSLFFVTFFPIYYVLLPKRRQNVQKLNNFKEVYVTRRYADQISWPFVKRDFDMLRILNLHISA